MALNVIKAKFAGQTSTWTDYAWQWDYGQILVFEGLDLPEAYEVHFSNVSIGGESITQIGGKNGVTIPDQFFTTGETIYAWIYLHQGADDGETVYSVTIPVKKRPQPSDDVPTPVEQSAIDQAIAALNIAVEKAEDAIEHYPRIDDGTWWVWDVTEEEWVDTGVQAQGHDGEDGVSPEITVQDIANGHRVTITDATGTTTFDVIDGENGADGISPDVSIQNITNGHRVTITDAGGTHTFDVMDGEPGATGNGIASITKTGTAGLVDTYTITFTNGQTTTFTVTNGTDASVTVDDELSTTSENPVQNKVIAGEIGDLKEELNQKVDDVQVNGTSVVNQGVANVPLATDTDPGTVIVNNYYGVTMVTSGTGTGMLRTYTAPDSQIKAGTNTYRPIVPNNQHQSAFYGMAKAAGDTTQSASSNAVGTYTEEAKNKICNMLGTSRKMRLLKKINVTEASSSVGFELDENNKPFAVDEITVIACIPATTTATRTISYSIEETTTTSSSSKWVAQIPNSTNTTQDTIAISKIIRNSVGWRAFHNFAYGVFSGVYTGAVSVKGTGVAITMNGASWVRTNNPLYATKFAIALSTDPIPAGAYFEIYAHDYQG